MTHCPLCGARLDVIAVGGVVEQTMIPGFQFVGEPLPRACSPAAFSTCPACEFVDEAPPAPIPGLAPTPSGVPMKKKPAKKSTPAKAPVVARASSRRFAVAASYTGDCCATPHVWVAVVRADDAAAAETAHRKRVAKQFTCHDVIALPFSPKTKAPIALGPSGHRAAAS